VALDAVMEQESLAQLASRHGVHPAQVGQWKRQLAENAAAAFESGVAGDQARREEELLRIIGELTVERDFLARGLQRCR
jgi:transposase